MHRKLRENQLALVNKNGPILLHHNARPHLASVITQTKLNNLGIKVLFHPPYCSALSPADFHFLKDNLKDNFTTNRQFQNHVAVEETFKEFIQSRHVDFYTKVINDLITSWQKCIQSQGYNLIKYVIYYLFCLISKFQLKSRQKLWDNLIYTFK